MSHVSVDGDEPVLAVFIDYCGESISLRVSPARPDAGVSCPRGVLRGEEDTPRVTLAPSWNPASTYAGCRFEVMALFSEPDHLPQSQLPERSHEGTARHLFRLERIELAHLFGLSASLFAPCRPEH